MIIKTVTIYVFLDNILKSMNSKEPERHKTIDAEIMKIHLLKCRLKFEAVQTCSN
jgi:hypothetical protein